MNDLDAGGVARLMQGQSKQLFFPLSLQIFDWYNLRPHTSGSVI